MKAIVRERYGRPDVLELRDIDPPAIADDQVLVRVRATSLNASEWYDVTGPYFARLSSGLRKPKRQQVAGDLAGTVEAVGHGVTARIRGGSRSPKSVVPPRGLAERGKTVPHQVRPMPGRGQAVQCQRGRQGEQVSARDKPTSIRFVSGAGA